MKNEIDFLNEAQNIFRSYEFEKLDHYNLNQDLSKYCYSATYPPLKALKDSCDEHPFAPSLPNEFNLYIHYPFCSGRCSFCHFNILPEAEIEDMVKYKKCLSMEIDFIKKYSKKSKVHQVYFGGGTPSLMSIDDLNNILNHLKSFLKIDSNVQITLEIHPELIFTKANEYLVGLKKIGINRISIGVQDFNDSVLKETNRRHNSTEALEVIQLAKDLGFIINIDLLAPLPTQTIQTWQKTLLQAFELDVDTITLYTTSIKKTMPIASHIKQGKPIPNQNEVYLFYILAQLYSKEYGFEEMSSRWFSNLKKNKLVKNSLVPHLSVLGIGCGAYGNINGMQYYNIPNLQDYFKALETNQFPIWKTFQLSNKELMHQELVMSARGGTINFNKFQIFYDSKIDELFKKKFEILSQLELVKIENRICQMTNKGKILSDEIAKFFMSEEVHEELIKNKNVSGYMYEHLNHFYDV